MTTHANNDDSYVSTSTDLARVPEGLGQTWLTAPGTEKLDAILSHPDPVGLVQSMPTNDVYCLVHDIGVESSLELLPLLSPDQWQGFVDLGGWEKDQIAIKPFSNWMEAAMTMGPETFGSLLKSVDPEYLVTWLMKIAQVHDRDLDHDQVPDALSIIPTPDADFFLLIPVDDPMIPAVHQMLKILYETQMERARRILKACTSELLSDLEENCYQFRSGRMKDLGFSSLDEATCLFETMDVQAFRQALLDSLEESPPLRGSYEINPNAAMLVLHGVETTPFLSRALAEMPAGEKRDALTQSFVHLSHRILVATQADLSDVAVHRNAVRYGYATVSLGLEHLSDGDEILGTQILEKGWLVHIFQVGHSLLSGIQQKARRVRHRMGGDRPYTLLGAEINALLEGLVPLVPRRVDGHDIDGHPEYAHISSLEERAAVQEPVSFANTVVSYFEKRFGFTPEALDSMEFTALSEDDRAHIRFSTLLLTALANQAAGNGFSLEPVSTTSLEHFATAVLQDEDGERKVRPALRSLLVKMAEEGEFDGEEQRMHLVQFVDDCFQLLEETLSGLPAGEAIDARYLGHLLLIRDDADEA